MKHIFIRFAIVLFLSLFWIAYRIFYISEDKFFRDYKECAYDFIQDNLFFPLTEFISQNLTMRGMLLIFCGSITDLYLFYFLIAVYKSCSNFKPLLHISMFYSVKIIIDQIFRFKILSIFLFEEPGYPSLIFDYKRTPYTFYSEYSGLPIVLATHFKDFGYSFLFKSGLLISILNSFVVIILRKNSVIDVIFGMIAAHYMYLLTEKIYSQVTNKIPIEKLKLPQKLNSEKNTITIENKKEIDNCVEMT